MAFRSYIDSQKKIKSPFDFPLPEIAVASGNSVLTHIVDVVLRLFQEEQRMTLHIHGSQLRDYQKHLSILEAMSEGTLAVRRMHRYVDGVRTGILKRNLDLDQSKERK
jgi:DNA-binding FadR family transcriptional regulator